MPRGWRQRRAQQRKHSLVQHRKKMHEERKREQAAVLDRSPTPERRTTDEP